MKGRPLRPAWQTHNRALRYQFFAERAAAKIEGIAEGTEAESVKRVGIIGAGTMGGGMAMCFAQAGFQVTLVDQTGGLDRGMGIILKNHDISLRPLSSDQVSAPLSPQSDHRLGVLEGNGSHH